MPYVAERANRLLEIYRLMSPLEQIAFARDHGVLGILDGHKLPEEAKQGVTMFFCRDSDQAPDFIDHQRQLLHEHTHRIGPSGWLGGALAIPKRSPMIHSQETRTELLWQLRMGSLLGKDNAVELQSHCVCGMAAAFGFCIFQCFDLLYEAKDETEANFERRAETASRYYFIRQKHGRPLSLQECTAEAMFNPQQIWRMQFLECLQQNSLGVNIFERMLVMPKILTVFHVDYTHLGRPDELRSMGIILKLGKTKLTHYFDRDKWLRAQDILLQPDALENWRALRLPIAA
jgi:hypothetical protein